MKSLEKLLYCLVWSSSVVYALYRFVTHTQNLIQIVDKNDFSKGWLTSGHKDTSDIEWTSLTQTFRLHFHWLVIHSLLTQLISRFHNRSLPLFFITYSSLAIVNVLSFNSLLIIWCNILLSLLIHRIGCQKLCYALFVLTLYIVHSRLFWAIKTFCRLNQRQSFLFEVCMAWLNAKCLSLSIDRIRFGQHNTPLRLNDMLKTIAYCFYLPAFYTGPVYHYSSFIKQFDKLPVLWTTNRFYTMIKQLIRYAIWILIFEYMLHFVYSTSVQYYPELSESFDIWTLCGLGFALPLMFFIKYFIIYGSVEGFAQLDGIQLPPPPKCIARIHLCTYLWRHFDRGLHSWLTNYFYKPMIGSNWFTKRRILAAFVCFACVCLWHGMDAAVIVWSVLNFFGVSFEIVAHSIESTLIWNRFKTSLSNDCYNRLVALIASPFFAIAFVSNIFFLSNWDVGYCFVRRILVSFPNPLITVLIIMYCGCHVSMFCSEREQTIKFKSN